MRIKREGVWSMKRCLSFFLIFMIIFAALPLGVSAEQGGKLIALTFDDGPHSADTSALLDGLKERNVKVTFFTLGENASYNQELIRRAYSDGHEIACHSWNHPNLVKLADEQVISQVEDSMAVLDEACGTDSSYLFRPPYGSADERVRSLIQYPMIIWSVDPEDWKYRDEDHVHNAIVNDAYDGAIVLAHDIHATTIPGALAAIDDLVAQGYEFVTVSELFRRRGVELQPGTRYFDCKNNGTDFGPIPKPEITYTMDQTTMSITISANTDAPIYYTTDGSIPNEESKVYEGPFTVDYPCNIRAVAAYKLNGSRSDVAVLAPNSLPSETPAISITDMMLMLTTSTEGASIFYTTDGSDPAEFGAVYTEPIELPGGCEIRAVTGGEFYQTSQEIRRYCSARGQLYSDMKPEDWYFDSVDRMVSERLMTGEEECKIDPLGNLTRGMLAAMLYAYSGESLEAQWQRTNAFTDVASEQYYSEAVEWVFRKNMVSGFTADQFGAENYVTRQELCRIADRFLRERGHQLPIGESCEDRFDDYDKIANWALSSVEAMASAGIITGDGYNFSPKGNTTRAEAAVIFLRMMDYEASLR